MIAPLNALNYPKGSGPTERGPPRARGGNENGRPGKPERPLGQAFGKINQPQRIAVRVRLTHSGKQVGKRHAWLID
jgi:hypothetical protein